MGRLPEIGSKAPQPGGVNIIRADYLTNNRVIIATARAKRPEQFSAPKEKRSLKKGCPFEPANQDQIILIDEQKADTAPGWQFRSVENVFGILAPRGDIPDVPNEHNQLFIERNAYGYAEVVIETPEHNKELEDLSPGTIASLFRFLARRVHALQYKPGVRYISVFKNRGHAAGASIAHSHTQIITTPHVPRFVQELKQAATEYTLKKKRNPFLEIIDRERGGPRFVMENKHIACFTPFASEVPMEAWVVPKRNVTSMTQLTDDEHAALEDVLRHLLTRLNTLGTPPYNLLFMNDKEHGTLQFHLRLRPRLGTPPAGFEYITGLHVNPTLPEDAAAFYRGEQ